MGRVLSEFRDPDAQIPDLRHGCGETKVSAKDRQNAAVAKASEGFFPLVQKFQRFQIGWDTLFASPGKRRRF
jgi:hypothetical protein